MRCTSACSRSTARSSRRSIARDAQWRLGESHRRLGELDKAVDALRDAADSDPGSPEPLRALARVYEQTGDWEDYIRNKRRRLEVATGAERFDLLLEIGDAEFSEAERPHAAPARPTSPRSKSARTTASSSPS